MQPAEGERYAEGVEEISEDEINSIAEELTKEELEELEVCKNISIGNTDLTTFEKNLPLFTAGGEGCRPYEGRTVTPAVNYVLKLPLMIKIQKYTSPKKRAKLLLTFIAELRGSGL